MDTPGELFQSTPLGFRLSDVTVRLARSDEFTKWDKLMDTHHYLGFKQFAGRGLRYVFEWRRDWIGQAGWQSGALICQPRDRWIGWRRAQQFRRLHLVCNNTRLLLLGEPGVFPNLASFALAQMTRRLSDDWAEQWGHPILIAETFVDGREYSGTIYKILGESPYWRWGGDGSLRFSPLGRSTCDGRVQDVISWDACFSRCR